MKLTRKTMFFAWIGAAIVVAAVSFVIGGSLHPDEEPFYLFDTDAPAFTAPAEIAATSPGGFTGFGETDGSTSRVVVSGRIVELEGDAMVLEGAQGQRASLSFSEAPRLFRLEASSVELREGLNVSLRLNDARDTVEAVLVLSAP